MDSWVNLQGLVFAVISAAAILLQNQVKTRTLYETPNLNLPCSLVLLSMNLLTLFFDSCCLNEVSKEKRQKHSDLQTA